MYFIITMGISGSGKTSLIEKTLNYLDLENKSYKKILIDDLIENNNNYKNKIRNIINQNTDLDFIDKKIVNKFTDAYFSVRNTDNCHFNNEKIKCDILNDIYINLYTQNKEQIIILETQGLNIPAYIGDYIYNKDKYNLIYTYSLINLKIAYNRNISRFKESLEKFKQNNTNPAPRLPDINKLSINLLAIEDCLLKIYSLCIKKYNKKTCGCMKINRLLLFDNIKLNNNIPIFDSSIHKLSVKKFKELIHNYFI